MVKDSIKNWHNKNKEKLSMKEMRPYLIQRCELKKTPGPITGFDSIFRCDYMGSSEFEFGALPKSLRRITANLSDYIIENSEIRDIHNKRVFVIAPKQLINDCLAFLPKIQDKTQRCKEITYFDEMLKGTKKFTQVHLWWDIENDWFFCIGKDTANLLVKGLEALKKKWAVE